MLAKQAAHTLCVTGIGGVPTPHVLSYFFKSRWNAAKWPWLLRQQQGFNWSPRNRRLCEPIRGLQNLESSRKGTGLFFSLLRKEPKVAQRVATLWTPRDGSKLYRLCFFVTFLAFVPKQAYGATRFFGCFEPVRKGCCSADARLMFFENGMLYSKLTQRNVFK